MNGNNASFLWNEYGLSSFWNHTDVTGAISGILGEKFVRFDKYGLYGIDGALNDEITINGKEWYPGKYPSSGLTPEEEIEEYSTFALTWEGLKVSNKLSSSNPSVIKIGRHAISKDEKRLISAISNGEEVFSISEDGEVSIKGRLQVKKATKKENSNPNLLDEYNETPWYLKPEHPNGRSGATLPLSNDRFNTKA
jgi:hypothetical protein